MPPKEICVCYVYHYLSEAKLHWSGMSAIPHRIKLGEKFDALGWLLGPFFGPKTLLEVLNFALVLAALQNFDFLHFLCLSHDSP